VHATRALHDSHAARAMRVRARFSIPPAAQVRYHDIAYMYSSFIGYIKEFMDTCQEGFGYPKRPHA
jgi:hypothetical protein